MSWAPLTTVCAISQKKNWHLKLGAPHGSYGPTESFVLSFRAEYSVNSQTEPKTKTCFGLPKPSPITNNFCKSDLRFLFCTRWTKKLVLVQVQVLGFYHSAGKGSYWHTLRRFGMRGINMYLSLCIRDRESVCVGGMRWVAIQCNLYAVVLSWIWWLFSLCGLWLKVGNLEKENQALTKICDESFTLAEQGKVKGWWGSSRRARIQGYDTDASLFWVFREKHTTTDYWRCNKVCYYTALIPIK